MQNSKLVETFKSLTKEELRQIETRLVGGCIVLHSKAETLELFYVLKKLYPECEGMKLEKGTLFKKLFPKQAYDEHRLERVMYFLLRAIEQYIAIEYSDVQTSQTHTSLALARYYRERNLVHRSDYFLKKAQSAQEQITEKAQSDYYKEYLIELEQVEQASNDVAVRRSAGLNMLQLVDRLDIFHLSTKLAYLCIHVYQQFTFDAEVEREINEIEAMLLKKDLKTYRLFDIPLITLSYKAIVMVRDFYRGEDSTFQEFRQLLTKHIESIPLDRRQSFCYYERNYCIKKYKLTHDKAYQTELFKMYKKHLDLGVLFYDGCITPEAFKNIVIYGLEENELVWTKEFIENYGTKIGKTNNPQEMLNLCWANYHYHCGAYEKALDLCNNNYQETFDQLTVRRLRIRIYYNQESVLLDDEVESFKIYVYRAYNNQGNIPSTHYDTNRNFIDALRQILHSTSSNNATRLARIKDYVLEKTCNDTEWLLEVIDDMMSKARA